jgi:ankyrin repeat protein
LALLTWNELVNRETAQSIITRALAFASTLVFSFAIVSGLPKFKEQRQRYFTQATMDGSLSRMRLLHFAGANINSRSNGCMPLFIAAGEGRSDVVRYLLAEGADVNAREQLGDTALTEAAYYGHVALVKELLAHGADVNAIGNDGTALDIALNRNNSAVADLLKHHGGKRTNELR